MPEIRKAAVDPPSPVIRVGSFDSPPTPARQELSAPAALQVGKFEQPKALASGEGIHAAITSAGFGVAAAAARPRGDPTGGTVATGTFGAAETIPPPRPATPGRVAKTEFGSVEARPVISATAAPMDDRSMALEILDKPRPLYSDEARRLKLEGMVVLEMSFAADGSAHVLRVVRGLGHGLDENAIRAATAIRFRPALQHSRPIDTVALVRIEFQMAY